MTTTHDCNLTFKHTECTKVVEKGTTLGWVFRNDAGDWMYVDTRNAPGGRALDSGAAATRAACINWLRLGRG